MPGPDLTGPYSRCWLYFLNENDALWYLFKIEKLVWIMADSKPEIEVLRQALPLIAGVGGGTAMITDKDGRVVHAVGAHGDPMAGFGRRHFRNLPPGGQRRGARSALSRASSITDSTRCR